MNLVLLFPEQRASGDVFVLGERYATHARKTWKARPGDVVRVGLAGGNRGTARVVSLAHRELRLELAALDESPPPPLGRELALALPRPPILRRCLQQATTLGVKRIHLFHSARVEKSFWSSRQLAPEAIREQLVLGLEQAGDTVMPSVVLHRKLRAFCEEVTDAGTVVADPSGAPAGMVPSGVAPAGPVGLVAVGPEGGFLGRELDALRERGARIVSLGERILRVDTACVLLLRSVT